MRLTLLAILCVFSLAGCGHQPDAVQDQKLVSREKCFDKAGNDGVKLMRCETPERLAFSVSLRFMVIPVPSGDPGPPKHFEILARRGYVVTRVLELKTKAVCDVDVKAARISSYDGENGYLFVPAVCNGKPTEFAWKMEGEFDLYLGRQPEPGF